MKYDFELGYPCISQVKQGLKNKMKFISTYKKKKKSYIYKGPQFYTIIIKYEIRDP